MPSESYMEYREQLITRYITLITLLMNRLTLYKLKSTRPFCTDYKYLHDFVLVSKNVKNISFTMKVYYFHDPLIITIVIKPIDVITSC